MLRLQPRKECDLTPNSYYAAANPAIALWLQACPLAGLIS